MFTNIHIAAKEFFVNNYVINLDKNCNIDFLRKYPCPPDLGYIRRVLDINVISSGIRTIGHIATQHSLYHGVQVLCNQPEDTA